MPVNPVSDDTPRRDAEDPFDEGAALAELERVRQEIERYQAIRVGVTEEFERFIKSFRTPERPVAASFVPAIAPPAPVPPPQPPPPAIVTAPPVAAPPILEPPPPAPPVAVSPPVEIAEPERREPVVTIPAVVPIPAPVQIEDVAPQDTFDRDDDFHPTERFDAVPPFEAIGAALPPPLEEINVPMPPPPKAAPSQARTWLVLGSVATIIAVGGYLWTTRGTGSPPVTNAVPAPSPAATPTPVPETTPPPATPPPAPAAAASPQPTAPAPTVESVLTTTEHAWVRITANGEKLLERELPAGARIPLPASGTVVIRTGNAGAVRVRIAGADQGALGREGEVVTRTFNLRR